MSFSKVLSLVGNLYESDGLSRTTREQLSAATYQLVDLFEFNADLDANDGPVAISFQNASKAEFFFARVAIPEGGDCTFNLTFAGKPVTFDTWLVGTTYAAGEVVVYLGINYASLAGSNTGNQPDTDAGVHWLPLTTSISANTVIKIPVNGGEMWINKTNMISASVQTVSGCSVQVIGGSR